MVPLQALRSGFKRAAVPQSAYRNDWQRKWCGRTLANTPSRDLFSEVRGISGRLTRQSRYISRYTRFKRHRGRSENPRNRQSSHQQEYEDLYAELCPEKGTEAAGRANVTPPIKSLRPLDDTTSRPTKDSKISYHASDQWTPANSLRQSPSTSPPSPVALVVYHACKSLTEGDFRRMTPKHAKHLREWSGPGSILKIIPARDYNSLEQTNFYYLFFNNQSQAEIFQRHWRDLHTVAKHFTPTGTGSLVDRPPNQNDQDELQSGLRKPNAKESGITTMPIAKGKTLGFEWLDLDAISDTVVLKVLQDYTALPPSITFQAPINKCEPDSSLRKLSEDLGYSIITRQGWTRQRDWTLLSESGVIASKGLDDRLFRQDRSNRAVKFHFQGCQQPGLVHALIKADAADRGVSWDCQLECRAKLAARSHVEANEEVEDPRTRRATLSESQSQGELFWILTFADEDNARRFVRRWHKRNISLGKHVDEVVAEAELLW